MKSFMGILRGPEIWIVLALLFVLSGLLMGLVPGFPETNLTLEFVAVLLVGVVSYLLGVKFHRKITHLSFIPILVFYVLGVLLAMNTIGMSVFVAALVMAFPALCLWVLKDIPEEDAESTYLFLFLAGLSTFLLNVVLNGVPLLNPGIRFELFYSIYALNIPSFFLMAYAAVKSDERRNLFFPILLLSTVVITFRFYFVTASLAWILVSMRRTGTRKALLFILPVVGIVLVAGVHIYGTGSAVGVIGRPAHTVSVLGDIVETSFPWGSDPSCFVSDCGRMVARDVLGYDARLTTTAFGKTLYSFGLLGVAATLFFLGAVLKGLRKEDYALYCLLFAYFLGEIERGFAAGEMAILTFLGYSSVWLKNRRTSGSG